MSAAEDEFIQRCKAFQPGQGDFASLLNMGGEVLSRSQRDLADMFEVTPSTVCRWMAGKSAPLPSVQKSIIASLRRRLE